MKPLERAKTTRDSRHTDFRLSAEIMKDPGQSLDKRPHTSAGIGERRLRSSSRAKAAIQVPVKSPTSGEDLQKANRTVEYTDGLDTFKFPTPSPRRPPRSATFQYSPSPLYYESPNIGLAIGSPSHAPPSWGRSFTEDNITAMAPQQPPNRKPPLPPQQTEDRPGAANASPGLERRKTGWKTLGSIFRKLSKSDKNQEPFYKCKPDNDMSRSQAACSPQIASLTSSATTSPALQSPRHVSTDRTPHSRTPSWTLDRWRVDSHEHPAQTACLPPSRARLMRSTPSAQIKPIQASVDIFKSPTWEQHNDSPLQPGNFNLELLQPLRTPRLNLEFEKPEFERYSIMFNKLLSNESKPSLFERRQSRLSRTKSGRKVVSDETFEIAAAVFGGSRRSLTSPYLTSGLPIKTDKDQSNNQENEAPDPAQYRPRPLLRSNTAPPSAMSPIAASFMRQTQDTPESSPESPSSDTYSESSLPSTPTTITTCTDTESIKKVIEANEPAWDMITSFPVKVTSPISGEQRPEPFPRIKSPKDLERQLVQVSVARQVSVSRARMRVQRAMDMGEQIVSLRPRVVELTRNRKSTVGVLESAADEVVEPMPVRRSQVVEISVS